MAIANFDTAACLDVLTGGLADGEELLLAVPAADSNLLVARIAPDIFVLGQYYLRRARLVAMPECGWLRSPSGGWRPLWFELPGGIQSVLCETECEGALVWPTKKRLWRVLDFCDFWLSGQVVGQYRDLTRLRAAVQAAPKTLVSFQHLYCE